MSNPDSWIWFDSAEECAKSAVVVFNQMRWRWSGEGVPTESMILEELLDLRKTLSSMPSQIWVETGRLRVERTKFAHQKVKELKDA